MPGMEIAICSEEYTYFVANQYEEEVLTIDSDNDGQEDSTIIQYALLGSKFKMGDVVIASGIVTTKIDVYNEEYFVIDIKEINTPN